MTESVIKTDRMGMCGQRLRCTGLHCCRGKEEHVYAPESYNNAQEACTAAEAAACWMAAMSTTSAVVQVPSCRAQPGACTAHEAFHALTNHSISSDIRKRDSTLSQPNIQPTPEWTGHALTLCVH